MYLLEKCTYGMFDYTVHTFMIFYDFYYLQLCTFIVTSYNK